jgi:hypothetical protein
MKIRSVLLGSVAVAGLTTAGYAADLGVVTSLDVCDELGLSGLTISSDDNCLVITGGVTFEYDWGDYAPGFTVFSAFARSGNTVTVIDNDGVLDSNADVDAWLKFVGTADSDFGPASATIKLISEDNTGTSDWTVGIDEAWVSIGDTTMLMAGYKGSIFNAGDDGPLNYLGLFNSSDVNTGVGFASAVATGGDVIQVVSNLGNGVSVGGGLEALGAVAGAPSLVGVLSYAGDGVTAHASTAFATATGLWNIHAGFTGTWDPVKIVGAVAADSTGWWNVLGSASATFDMFTIAASGEATSAGEWGVGGSVKATVTDGITLNLGGRYFAGVADDVGQAEAALSAAVTETITLTAAVGSYWTDGDFYGKAGLAWAPGGGFTSSTSIEVHSTGGYKAVFKAAKSIK